MAAASREAGVPVVTGDTKVVEQGKGDGVFISTTGVGVVPPGVLISGRNARPGDVVLVSGSIGDHGVAVLSQRESLAFETTIECDTAALHTLVAAMLAAAPGAVRVLRDPTRGGLATTLNEIARQSGVGMLLQEAAIPGEAAGRRRLRAAGPGPAVRGQRRQADRGRWRPRSPKRCWPRCARTRWAATPRASARSRRTRTTSCRWPRASVGGGWWTGCSGEQLPRIC